MDSWGGENCWLGEKEIEISNKTARIKEF